MWVWNEKSDDYWHDRYETKVDAIWQNQINI